ncbi:Leucine-rich repeat-containing protein [Artemisia annua]|uniref:Leucine-rich repeat-containing protein n=1 Tax=Artemisia annua TaxID=35608 RepID=A0A2U1KFR8_ARTAN|nr:Leucine-rich repeat-containing protein [Artemisia annua]
MQRNKESCLKLVRQFPVTTQNFRLAVNYYKMYASLYFPQITELLHKLPRVILLMLKTNDCLRSVNNALIKRPSVESFIIIGRVSSEALIEEKLSHAKSLFGLLHVWLEEISLQARFFIMQVALWMLQFRTALAL